MADVKNMRKNDIVKLLKLTGKPPRFVFGRTADGGHVLMFKISGDMPIEEIQKEFDEFVQNPESRIIRIGTYKDADNMLKRVDEINTWFGDLFYTEPESA